MIFLAAIPLILVWFYLCISRVKYAILTFLFYSVIYQFYIFYLTDGLIWGLIRDILFVSLLLFIFLKFFILKYVHRKKKDFFLTKNDVFLLLFILFSTLYLFFNNTKGLVTGIIEYRYFTIYPLFIIAIQLTNIHIREYLRLISFFWITSASVTFILYFLNMLGLLSIGTLKPMNAHWATSNIQFFSGYANLSGIFLAKSIYLLTYGNMENFRKNVINVVFSTMSICGLILCGVRNQIYVFLFIYLQKIIKKNKISFMLSITFVICISIVVFSIVPSSKELIDSLLTSSLEPEQISTFGARNSRIELFGNAILESPLGHGWGNLANNASAKLDNTTDDAFDITYLGIVYALGYVGVFLFILWVSSELVFLQRGKNKSNISEFEKEYVLAFELWLAILIVSLFHTPFLILHLVVPVYGLIGILRKSSNQ